MTRERHDLRKTNDRHTRKHKRTPLICWLPRGVRPARNRRRLIDLLVENGVLR